MQWGRPGFFLLVVVHAIGWGLDLIPVPGIFLGLPQICMGPISAYGWMDGGADLYFIL